MLEFDFDPCAVTHLIPSVWQQLRSPDLGARCCWNKSPLISAALTIPDLFLCILLTLADFLVVFHSLLLSYLHSIHEQALEIPVLSRTYN